MQDGDQPANLKRRALRAGAWAMAGGNVSQLLAFAMFLVISRMVGPAAFGTVAVGLALVELLRAVSSESVVANLVARGRLEPAAFDAGFAYCIASALVLTAALIFAAPALARLFSTPDLAQVLPQLAPLLIVHAASRVQEAQLTIDLQFRTLAIRAVSAALIGGLAGIGAAATGYGVEALVLQQWVTAGVSLVLLWIVCPWRPGFKLEAAALAGLGRETLAYAPSGLISQLATLIDGLAVAAFSGPAAAGVYNLGKRVRLALHLGVTTALNRVSLPAFARVKSDAGRLSETLEQTMRISLFAALPVFVGIAAVAPEMIHLFLGPAWADAAAPLTLLMIAGAIAITTSYCDNLLLVLERRRWIFTLRMLKLAVLVAAIALFGRLGPVAVAGAFLAAIIAHSLAAWILVSRIAPMRAGAFLDAVATPLAISLAMLALLAALRTTGPFAHLPEPARLALLVIAGAAFYLAAARLFAPRSLSGVVSAARTVLAI